MLFVNGYLYCFLLNCKSSMFLSWNTCWYSFSSHLKFFNRDTWRICCIHLFSDLVHNEQKPLWYIEYTVLKNWYVAVQNSFKYTQCINRFNKFTSIEICSRRIQKSWYDYPWGELIKSYDGNIHCVVVSEIFDIVNDLNKSRYRVKSWIFWIEYFKQKLFFCSYQIGKCLGCLLQKRYFF